MPALGAWLRKTAPERRRFRLDANRSRILDGGRPRLIRERGKAEEE